jgi:hypothetical protein
MTFYEGHCARRDGLAAVTCEYLDVKKKNDLGHLITELRRPRSPKCRIIGRLYERREGPRKRSP